MKRLFIPLLFLALSAVLPAQVIRILPEKIQFQKYYADALSHQFSISKHLQSREWFGNIGAVLPVFDVSYDSYLMQVSAAATVFNTIIKTPGHIQVYTVDYLVDFFADYLLAKNLPLRFLYGHLSAHYSDDGIVELNHYPISYVRDYVGLHMQYKVSDSKIYMGMYYNFHIEPAVDKKVNVQFGGDKFFNLTRIVDFYAAVDFKFREEVDFTPVQSYQAGFKFFDGERRALRTAYTYRTGFEERGQLYNLRASKHTLGIYLDF